jgi:hypothetical protein
MVTYFDTTGEGASRRRSEIENNIEMGPIGYYQWYDQWEMNGVHRASEFFTGDDNTLNWTRRDFDSAGHETAATQLGYIYHDSTDYETTRDVYHFGYNQLGDLTFYEKKSTVYYCCETSTAESAESQIDRTDYRYEYVFDNHGNWIRRTRHQTELHGASRPATVTIREITYYR